MPFNKTSLDVSWCQSKPVIRNEHIYAPQEAKKVRGANGWLALTPRNAQIRLIEQHLKIKKRAKRVAITLASLPEALGLIGSGIGLNLRREEEK